MSITLETIEYIERGSHSVWAGRESLTARDLVAVCLSLFTHLCAFTGWFEHLKTQVNYGRRWDE